MATIYVDGQPYEVEDGQNLLHAVLSLGFNLQILDLLFKVHNFSLQRAQ